MLNDLLSYIPVARAKTNTGRRGGDMIWFMKKSWPVLSFHFKYIWKVLIMIDFTIILIQMILKNDVRQLFCINLFLRLVLAVQSLFILVNIYFFLHVSDKLEFLLNFTRFVKDVWLIDLCRLCKWFNACTFAFCCGILKFNEYQHSSNAV